MFLKFFFQNFLRKTSIKNRFSGAKHVSNEFLVTMYIILWIRITKKRVYNGWNLILEDKRNEGSRACPVNMFCAGFYWKKFLFLFYCHMYLWSSFIKFVFHNISITHIPDYAITYVSSMIHMRCGLWTISILVGSHSLSLIRYPIKQSNSKKILIFLVILVFSANPYLSCPV